MADRKPLPEAGQFSCEVCFQKYRVPETTVKAIRGHLKSRHGRDVDSRWVRRRLTEVPTTTGAST